MSALPQEESLVSQCLDFCQMLAGKSMPFSFSLNVGTHFSFSVDTRGIEAVPSPRKKKKTPSQLRRNARRKEEFLRKKLVSPAEKSLEVSEQEAKSPGKVPFSAIRVHPSPSPSSERRKVITVGKRKEAPTLCQLDGASPSAKQAARKEMTSRCEFCSKLEWEIGRLVMPEMSYSS